MRIVLGALIVWLLARGRFHTYLALATTPAVQPTPTTGTK